MNHVRPHTEAAPHPRNLLPYKPVNTILPFSNKNISYLTNRLRSANYDITK